MHSHLIWLWDRETDGLKCTNNQKSHLYHICKLLFHETLCWTSQYKTPDILPSLWGYSAHTKAEGGRNSEPRPSTNWVIVSPGWWCALSEGACSWFSHHISATTLQQWGYKCATVFPIKLVISLQSSMTSTIDCFPMKP